MPDDMNTVLVLLGLLANLVAVIHFFSKLEHRLTAVEIHIIHLMRKNGMSLRNTEELK